MGSDDETIKAKRSILSFKKPDVDAPSDNDDSYLEVDVKVFDKPTGESDSDSSGYQDPRRKTERHHYWGPVRIINKKSMRSFQAQSKDFHDQGAGIVFVGSHPTEGDEVLLEFLAQGEMKGFSVEAKVLYSIRDDRKEDVTHVGLKITHASKLAKTAIQDFIARNK